MFIMFDDLLSCPYMHSVAVHQRPDVEEGSTRALVCFGRTYTSPAVVAKKPPSPET